MSGTSLDGVDLAHCSFLPDGEGHWKHAILRAKTVRYPAEWRETLANLQDRGAVEYARTHVQYGHFLGRRIQEFLDEHNIRPGFVACHGHTIFHRPDHGYTAQIGDGETISSYLDCPLVCDFRSKDVACGGQGAPLVPFGESLLFPGIPLFLNLGGFANITGKGIAFDVSPCNFALNSIARQLGRDYDDGGNLARSGALQVRLFERLNSLPHYASPPPKSLGREWFEEQFEPVLASFADTKPEDLLHTCCRHIAFQTARAAEVLGVRHARVLITGGGAYNRFLIECLAEELRPLAVEPWETADPLLIDFKEAMIFAFLGLHALLGQPNVIPAVTGVSRPVVCGGIHLPSGGNWKVLA